MSKFNLLTPVRRRRVLLGAAALGAFGASTLILPGSASALPPMEIQKSERALGNADAPVTITEFASLSCPHCARFHNNVFPAIKKKYIETGKVRFIYRDFPTSPAQVSVGAAMVARCAPPARYFGMLDIFYKDQNAWFQESDFLSSLTKSARKGGMSSEDVRACLEQRQLADHIIQTSQADSEKFSIRGTPSFLINGELYRGNTSIEGLSDAIEAELK